MKRSVALSTVVALLACSGSGPPPPPLDTVLSAGQARAGRVTRQRELIGGPVAYGRVGDVWKLYNSRARFLIQDVGAAVGLDLYGGNLIDADIVRDGSDGTNGNDLFRELFPIVGLHGVKPRSIEVVSDGTRGGSAILRVHGTDAPTDILPQLDQIAMDLGGEVTVEYELAPDVPYLKITTTYQALSGQSLATLGLGDFLSFGASLAILSPENGFTGDAKTVSFLATAGDGSSYGYVYPKGAIQVPFVDASGTATLLVSPMVPDSGSAQVVRYLVVGDGSAASVTGPMYALRGLASAPLVGRALDKAGAPVAGARVTLFAAPYDAAAGCVDQAKARSDGSYQIDVPPGDYVAIAGAIGRLHGPPVAIHLPTGGATQDVTAGALGTVTLDVGETIGGQRVGAPAKISFESTNVEKPDPRFGPDPTESERNGVWAVAMTPDGGGSVHLKPGTYRATVSRGVEYELTIVDPLVVPADGAVALKADLSRTVDTTGWLAGDYHQHSQGSIDSPVPVRQRVIEDMAEGIEFPAATDHDNTTDFAAHIAAVGGRRWMNAVVGNEISVNGVGHFNGYPFTVDAADPFALAGARYWARQTVRQLTVKVHTGGERVLHVSHPRTRSLAGWFNTVRFDPTTGQAAQDFPIEGFEAVEVNGDLGQPADFLAAADAQMHKNATQSSPSGVPAMRDWFALLNLGKTITALGDSDTHQRNGGTGYPRSFVQLGTDDPAAATGAQLVAAMRAQKVSVSNGPFVTVTLNGQAKLGRAEAVSLGGAPSATLGIRAQAPRWIDVATVEVYANGRPLSLLRTGVNRFDQRPDGEQGSTLQAIVDPGDATTGAIRLDAQVIVRPTKDSWYVVVVRGAKSMLPVAGSSPYGYTNPIYADTAGDGWTAPGL